MFTRRSFILGFIFSGVGLIVFLFFAPHGAIAQTWFYPLDKTPERESYKVFGQFIDKGFYAGKENLFPNRFYGYHAGSDLEISPEELKKDVPIYAVSSGTIVFVGPVSGYGGLILEKIDNEDLTALYGHLKLTGSRLKTGDHVDLGQVISYLGNAFSSETGGERKHLHFAIYKGHDLYFRGYEDNKKALNEKWLDPLTFLSRKIAAVPSTETQATVSAFLKDGRQGSVLDLIINFFKDILRIF